MKSIMFGLMTLTITILVFFVLAVIIRFVDPNIDVLALPPTLSVFIFIGFWALVALSVRDIDHEIRMRNYK